MRSAWIRLSVAALLLGACGGADESASLAPAPATTAAPTVDPGDADLAWGSCADGPASRQEVAAAVIGTKVYVAGGLTISGDNTDVVEAYDTRSDTWSSLPPLPIALDHAMATEWQGKFVVLGGNTRELESRRVFVREGGAWETLPSLRSMRAAGAAVTVGDEIVVIGGLGPAGHLDASEIFDGTAWRPGPKIGSLRDHLAAATDGRLVYLVGGRREGGHFGDFEVMDPTSGIVTRQADMPTARSGLGAAFVGGRVIAVGGEGPRIFPEVEAYDVASKRWSRLADLPTPRHGVGVVAVRDTLYAVLGGSRVALAPSAACESLDLSG